jgi:hypothetical protein
VLAPKNVASGIFAALMIGILAFMAYALVYQTIPLSNRDALVYLLGIISANIGQVTSFFFGSSASSRTKDETISRIAKGE